MVEKKTTKLILIIILNLLRIHKNDRRELLEKRFKRFFKGIFWTDFSRNKRKFDFSSPEGKFLYKWEKAAMFGQKLPLATKKPIFLKTNKGSFFFLIRWILKEVRYSEEESKDKPLELFSEKKKFFVEFQSLQKFFLKQFKFEMSPQK